MKNILRDTFNFTTMWQNYFIFFGLENFPLNLRRKLFYLFLNRNTPRRQIIPETISNPGAFVLPSPEVFGLCVCSGVGSTFAIVLPLFCSSPRVLFSGCIVCLLYTSDA